jgi:hypothetical protein
MKKVFDHEVKFFYIFCIFFMLLALVNIDEEKHANNQTVSLTHGLLK